MLLMNSLFDVYYSIIETLTLIRDYIIVVYMYYVSFLKYYRWLRKISVFQTNPRLHYYNFLTYIAFYIKDPSPTETWLPSPCCPAPVRPWTAPAASRPAPRPRRRRGRGRRTGPWWKSDIKGITLNLGRTHYNISHSVINEGLSFQLNMFKYQQKVWF